jgi:hypothetical protein
VTTRTRRPDSSRLAYAREQKTEANAFPTSGRQRINLSGASALLAAPIPSGTDPVETR